MIPHEILIIEIEEQQVDQKFFKDIISLTVELDDELAASFNIELALLKEGDGRWPYVDDERLEVWNRVRITTGFEVADTFLIDGYITHVIPQFGDPAKCTLQILGMDRSVLMDQAEKIRAWPNKKDSDIVTEIFEQHALTPLVENTRDVHDEKVSRIIQRETDMQFVKRLAQRNNLPCYVEGNTGYMKPVQLDPDPQPVLAYDFGSETNLMNFSLDVDALLPANVTMAQVDRNSKEAMDKTVEESNRPLMGERDVKSLQRPGVPEGHLHLLRNITNEYQEMVTFCQAIYDQSEWFVSGEGEILVYQYRHILKPRQTVLIKGIGEMYSGLYYVNHVNHTFTSEGYQQYFQVKRNALMYRRTDEF